jgi:hypothetical protein
VSQLHSRHRRAELEREHAAIVARALRDNPGRHLDEARNVRSKLPGDPWGLARDPGRRAERHRRRDLRDVAAPGRRVLTLAVGDLFT